MGKKDWSEVWENAHDVQWNIIQPQKDTKLPFAEMWKDLETVIQTEVSQKGKNKYI